MTEGLSDSLNSGIQGTKDVSLNPSSSDSDKLEFQTNIFSRFSPFSHTKHVFLYVFVSVVWGDWKVIGGAF